METPKQHLKMQEIDQKYALNTGGGLGVFTDSNLKFVVLKANKSPIQKEDTAILEVSSVLWWSFSVVFSPFFF
jgi:hypothetical protein